MTDSTQRFLQLHFLTAYPPANLNRDDSGRPKTATIGGFQRLRISSQSLKSAWRNSDIFQQASSGNLGVRTRKQGEHIYNKLLEKGIEPKIALKWASEIIMKFGEVKSNKSDKKNKKDNEEKSKHEFPELILKQLVHFSPEELKAINELVNLCIENKTAPTKDQLDLLRKENSAADIACFGRMLAKTPEYNIEAAVQVAHAFTVHEVETEEDFFTAVDHLNKKEDTGSAHVGLREFGAGVFYNYICLDRELLKDNLKNDLKITQKTIGALIEAAAKVNPVGMQNSFASRAYTNYMLVEKGNQQPRSLMPAFLAPIKTNSDHVDDNFLLMAIDKLKQYRANLDQVFGACASGHYELDTTKPSGTLQELIDFATASIE